MNYSAASLVNSRYYINLSSFAVADPCVLKICQGKYICRPHPHWVSGPATIDWPVLCPGGSLSRSPPPVRLRAGGTHPTEMLSCLRKENFGLTLVLKSWAVTSTTFNEHIFTVRNSSCGMVMFSQTPPRQTATAADGTHPTGMHSCYELSYSL